LPEAKAGGAWLERLFVTVDSRRARRRLQFSLPKEVFDASTTDVSEIGFHFCSKPGEGACLGCIYCFDRIENARELHIAESLGVSLEAVKSQRVSENDARIICESYKTLSPNEIIGLAFDSLFKQLCGQSLLKQGPEKQVLAPFSFVSALAGTFLAFESMKRLLKGEVGETFNFWLISPWASPIVGLRRHVPPSKTCEIHGDEVSRVIYKETWLNQQKVV